MSFILVGTGPSRLKVWGFRCRFGLKGLQFKGFGERLYGLRTLGFKGVGFRAGRPSIEFRGILCRCPEAFEENVQISKKDEPQDKAWVARTVLCVACGYAGHCLNYQLP